MLHFSRWKSILIWLVVLLSVVIAASNVFSDTQIAALPAWIPHHKVALGLDLQGGTQMMLKVERADVVADRLQVVVNDVAARLRNASIRYTGLSGTGQVIAVQITDPSQRDAAVAALKPLTDRVGAGGLGGSIVEATVTPGDNGLLTVNITNDGIAYRISLALEQSMDIVRRRIEQMGNGEPLIRRQGSDRMIVQLAGLTDPQRLKNLLNQTAQLSFRLIDPSMPVDQAVMGTPPAGSEVMYSEDDPPLAYLVKKQPLVSGEDLLDAQSSIDPQTNRPVVTYRFDEKATKALAEATQRAVGKPFVVLLDDQVISAPTIRQPILDGTGQISGRYSVEGADDLAALLRAGALPATLTVVEERTVGPGLGADSIRSSIVAGIIATLAIFGFMLFFYGRFFGAVAIIALFFNVIMIVAVLSLMGSTLTLPGIAGIILTIGMAVDSNVLIYERIREEVKSGKAFPAACEAGFSRAFVTIVDANVTTLIAAIILFYVGGGPVRGFAVTLAIGILTTVFTAFTLTRWLVAVWIQGRHLKTMPRGVRTAIFDRSHIRFMGIRRYVFTASACLSLIAMIALVGVGVRLGVDFTGGSILEIRAKQGPADLTDIRTRLGELNLGEIQVQGFGDAESVLIRIQSQDGGENAEQSAITLVRGELAETYDFRRVEVVGPSVSGELTRRGTFAVLAALGAVFVYIWIRFAWQFAVGAVIATLHDIILTLGLFVLTGIEFNLTGIAALLTIIGYSLNDTVVVYDRMRENLRRYKQMPLPILIDASINQTLSRTILTAATTLLALAALYLFGGEAIRAFTFAMLFGVAIGTFSSIYIAAPVLILFRLRPEKFPGGDDLKRDNKTGAVIQPGKPAV